MNVIFDFSIPVFSLILIGYLCERSRLLGSNASVVLSRLAFFIVVPMDLFENFAKANINQLVYWPYVLAFLLSSILLIAVIVLITKLFFPQNQSGLALNIMGAAQCNTVYLAIPLFIFLFHSAREVFPIIIIQLFTVSLLTLFMLEMDNRKNASRLSSLLLIPFRTPVIIGAVLGILFASLHWPVPLWLTNILSPISQMAAPVALLALGAGLAEDKPHFDGKLTQELSVVVSFKTILHPLIAFVIGRYVFGLSNEWLYALILMSAMPAAKNTFIFAKRYQQHEAKAGLYVFFTTLVSFVTLNAIMLGHGYFV